MGQLEHSGCERTALEPPLCPGLRGCTWRGSRVSSVCLPAALASRDANPRAARGLAGTAAPGSGGFGCAGWAAPPGVDLGRRPARAPGMPRCWPLRAALGLGLGGQRGASTLRREPQLRWVSRRTGRREGFLRAAALTLLCFAGQRMRGSAQVGDQT